MTGAGCVMQAIARTRNGKLYRERTGTVGRPCRHDLGEIWNAIEYVVGSGCQWRLLPKDFPPFTTVQYHFYRWRDSGLFVLINEALVFASRLLEGREVEPTAAIIDSQSVKTTESGGPCRYDAGKTIKGRKRHIATDTEGHMLDGIVHVAGIQDRGCDEDVRATHPYALELKTLLRPDGIIRAQAVFDVEGVPTVVFVGKDDESLSIQELNDIRKRIWNQNLATVVIEVSGGTAQALPARKLSDASEQLVLNNVNRPGFTGD